MTRRSVRRETGGPGGPRESVGRRWTRNRRRRPAAGSRLGRLRAIAGVLLAALLPASCGGSGTRDDVAIEPDPPTLAAPSATVTVVPVSAVVAVEVQPASLDLVEGGASTLAATVTTTGDASREVAWLTSDASVAAVDETDGTVVAVGPGRAAVRAVSVVDPGVEGSAEVTVGSVSNAWVSVGDEHSAVRAEATAGAGARAWGSNALGQLGDGATVTRTEPVIVGSGVP